MHTEIYRMYVCAKNKKYKKKMLSFLLQSPIKLKTWEHEGSFKILMIIDGWKVGVLLKVKCCVFARNKETTYSIFGAYQFFGKLWCINKK